MILVLIKQVLCSDHHRDVMRNFCLSLHGPLKTVGLNSSSLIKELKLIIWPFQWQNHLEYCRYTTLKGFLSLHGFNGQFDLQSNTERFSRLGICFGLLYVKWVGSCLNSVIPEGFMITISALLDEDNWSDPLTSYQTFVCLPSGYCTKVIVSYLPTCLPADHISKTHVISMENGFQHSTEK